ncbi:uncharacterized protein LOC119719094 [Patiria miniata]|uniref:Uncharacterized protein n=1 Tax=Patiria miniata TaxID=46514 RepID=A0A913Z032_PATMI|nr:uncharacterized protein LOC119719094 [Patiria miniata]
MATGTSFDHYKFIKNHLECSICQDTYNQPKSLDCQHSFCKTCLETYHEGRYAGASKIYCPLCRQETPLPETGVQGLKTNFNLTNMLDDISRQEKDKSTLNYLEDPRRCGKHNGMVKQLYCELCEELICRKCAKCNHRHHGYIDKETASLEQRQSLKDLFPSLEEKIDECQQALWATSGAKDEFTSMIRQTTQKVQERVRQIRAVVSKQEEQLLTQIKKIERKYSNTFDHHEETVRELLHKAQRSLETAKDTVDVASDGDFLSLYPPVVRKDLRKLSSHQLPAVDLSFPDITFKGSISGVNDAGTSIGTVMLHTWEKFSEFGDFQSACDVASVRNSQPDEFAVINCCPQNGSVGIYRCTGYHNSQGCKISKTNSFRICAPSGISVWDDTLIVPSVHHQRVWTFPKHFLDNGTMKHGSFYTFQHHEAVGSLCEYIMAVLDSYFSITAMPRSVAVKSNGTIVIGDVLRNELTEHSLQGSLQRIIKLEIKPQFVAVDDAKERFVISDYRKATVVKNDGAAEFSIKPVIRGIPQEQTTCTGVCCDNSGIYLAMHGVEKGTGHVHNYSASGQFLSCIAQNLYQPMGITIVADGQKLAVADTRTVKVYHKAWCPYRR